ncbi:MAG: trypsin-like serine protease, partial [Gammaproteobacteria bacterium]|nr:trypsin-like serine protease [Gammaproteobacteria bacterium]
MSARFTLAAVIMLLTTPVLQAALPLTVDGQKLPTLAPMIKQVSPSVVNIAINGSVEVDNNPLFDDPFFRRFFNVPEQPQRRQFQSAGSGVIVDAEKGYILTNAHVVSNAEEIEVTLLDDRVLSAKVIGSDAGSDIAVIQVESKDLEQIALGDSDELEVGDFVVAIGNPFGFSNTVTSGIVSAKGRSGINRDAYEDFIQTDAPINPGNSGGALITLGGELIGINSAIISNSGGNLGIGFAIPINMAQSIMEQIIEFGEVRRG